ncbi:hypothetical protein BKA58DRAFT_438203 [Alternaria rosae]|uniref:uncharacterized protein n=1 Tax=Alternaria rosae TaxID=1187941 RepID=UPI001E8E644F|nr:uncharacterized protein BKA58DRAFT_438203 [Alternaria rosae]KAH6876258.1 hypothetical protein BKA58DRAFT_438203 [Alternaria rosae]
MAVSGSLPATGTSYRALLNNRPFCTSPHQHLSQIPIDLRDSTTTMKPHESIGFVSGTMLQQEDEGPTAAPNSEDPTDRGLQRLLDLPTELRCYILEVLIKDKHFETH